jgi:hypothetical protein
MYGGDVITGTYTNEVINMTWCQVWWMLITYSGEIRN